MLSDHERLALRHPRVLGFHKLFSEFHVFIEVGEERFKVRFRVFETGDQRFFFEQSHFIRTPAQADPESRHPMLHDQPHVALQHGIDTITSFYDDAVAQGHEPSLAWFVANDLY